MDLENEASNFCKKNSIVPVQVGYQGYPFVLCCGINSDGVHTMPHQEKKIQLGDIISIDTTVRVNEYCADGGFCMAIGQCNKQGQNLIDCSKRALNNTIKAIKKGVVIEEISKVIYKTAKDSGFDVLREYAGHGIGKKLHEEPYIPNFPMGFKEKIPDSIALALDILMVEGKPDLQNLRDGWSTHLKDGGRFAFSEKTIIVWEDHTEIINDFDL